jgi:predicted nucleic acid-binding protein
VVDALAVVDVQPRTRFGMRNTGSVLDSGLGLAAPPILDIEFMQPLCRVAPSRAIPTGLIRRAPDDFCDLLVLRHPHGTLGGRIWELRHPHSAYGATYVALAEALNIALSTCNATLARSLDHAAEVVLLE